MTRKKPAYITLPAQLHKAARMAAAKQGTTVSDYIAQLVARDCEASGIAALLATDDDGDEKREVRRGR